MLRCLLDIPGGNKTQLCINVKSPQSSRALPAGQAKLVLPTHIKFLVTFYMEIAPSFQELSAFWVT